MTTSGHPNDNVGEALGQALGHIRNATETLLAADHQTTESLLRGMACLDLQSMFGDVWPVWIPNDSTASESLTHAQAELAAVMDDVPLAVWAALRSLREQVDNGHH